MPEVVLDRDIKVSSALCSDGSTRLICQTETDQTLLLEEILNSNTERRGPGALHRTAPIDMRHDQVDRGNFQTFSTELERRFDDIWNTEPEPERKAHLHFGNWLVPHERVIHNPTVKVAKAQVGNLLTEPVKLPDTLDRIERCFEQQKPLPPAPPGLDLATQEAFFFNDGQDMTVAAIEHPVRTFTEVTISDSDQGKYTPEEVIDSGNEAVGLQAPVHFFNAPQDDWTGTMVQIRSKGMYYFEDKYISLDCGTYKIYKTKEKVKKYEAMRDAAKKWYSTLVKVGDIESDPNEIMRRRIRRALRESIQYNLTGRDRRIRYGISNAKDLAEQKARDTLRDMLSEADWRRYCTNSFVMVRGDSGRWYQVHRNERIRVYQKGELHGSICIHTDSDCPPTDHVIAMKIQIELDEESVWAEGNFTPARDVINADYSIYERENLNLAERVRLLRTGVG